MTNLLSKFIFSLIVSLGCSIAISTVVLFALGWIVNIFKLNYGRDAYWVFSATFFTFLISWVIGFGCLMAIPDAKETQKAIPKIKKIPNDDIKYVSNKASGTVESIHIGGRTEVVEVTGVELVYWPRLDVWQLDAQITQPEGRKNYFAPGLNGKINVDQKAGQLIEFGDQPWNGIADMVRGWGEFRCANIVFENGKPVSVQFSHVKFANNDWSIVAQYVAYF